MAVLAGIGAAAAIGLAGVPASAADTTTLGGNDLTVTRQKQPLTAPAPQDSRAAPVPLPDEQRQADAVKSMSGQVQSGVADVHPGEDSLGTGTSITH
jgi:hypothetical protein